MTKRIDIRPEDITVVPGPSFQAYDEDGPYSDWKVFVVFRPMAGLGLRPMTLNMVWDRRDEQGAAAMVERIREHGSINPAKWTVGDPWQPYHDGMTLQERLAPWGPEWERDERERMGLEVA